MNEQPVYRDVWFLDTNVLHYLRLYLKHASKENLYPYSSEDSSYPDAKRSLDDIQEGKLEKTLRRGLGIIDELLAMKPQVEYSPISEIELLVGRARGIAIESAAKEGVPDRWWSDLRAATISERVTTGDLASVKKKVEQLAEELDRLGIAIAVDAGRTREVWELAKCVTGLVVMDTADSVIYAGALAAQADCLITADQYLRETANRIHDAKDDRFESIRRELMRCVGGTIGSVGASNIKLPTAHTISARGKLQPSLPSMQRGRR